MTRTAFFLGAVGLQIIAAGAVPAFAQREIVQPLPAPGSDELGDALSRLARNPTDLDALLDAGDAALLVGDIEAAIGFFGRANQLSPSNPRIKLGLAKAYIQSRRPIEALRLFAEAEAAGVSNALMAEDRALAFDLVGDSISAQQLYRIALANGASSQIKRRLALSQAISGDREGMEATLLPMLEAGDVSAFRTRAFGLAILGDEKEAKDIANTMLPAGMGERMAPYLEYMPRLTRAQQAAAGNLGVFPRTPDIGSDDPRIAGYSGEGIRLVERPGSRNPGGPPEPVTALPVRDRQTLSAAPSGSPETGASRTPPADETEQGSPQPVEAPPARIAEAELPSPSSSSTSTAEPVVVAEQPLGPTDPEPVERVSLADAFSGFSLDPGASTGGAEGAVDITTIDIPREKAEPLPPPPPPAHPARHWVQVATGKDRDALGFDWRRISRKAEGKLEGKGPFVTPWGEANRLLAGPYDSAAEARKTVNELKEMGIDSFPFASAEGDEIEKLR